MNSNKLLLSPSKTEFLLIGTKTNNGSNFLNSQLYLSALISSQSALLLEILASSLILTCHSQIKLTPCLSCNFHIRDIRRIRHLPLSAATLLQRLPIHWSPANLIIVIHSTMAFRKLTWTKYSAYKILWLVSLQNTSKFEHITPIHSSLTMIHGCVSRWCFTLVIVTLGDSRLRFTVMCHIGDHFWWWFTFCDYRWWFTLVMPSDNDSRLRFTVMSHIGDHFC